MTMKTKLWIAGILFVLVALYSSAFFVHQTQQALILQFREAKRLVTEPGLHFKLPIIQNVIRYDKRIINHNLDPREIIALDKKRIIVDAFVKYRIIDPLAFKQSVENERTMSERLNSNLDRELRKVIGRVNLDDLLSEKRSNIMQKIKSNVNIEVKDFGIEVIDARIRRADLPQENSQAIYRRMQTEREKEAKEIRSTGEKEKITTISEADKVSKVTIAEAEREAQGIRGAGDAEASKIFADAFNKDPEFYAFYRSMEAYRRALKSGDTSMVLSPDSEFLKFLSDMKGTQ